MYPFDEIIGKKLDSVSLNKGRDLIIFNFEDGTVQAYVTEGDCCSRSWVEHLETYGTVEGATILSVDESSIPGEYDPEHDYLQVYHTSFNTDKGRIVLEYRNSSNGYYGGYLSPCSV